MTIGPFPDWRRQKFSDGRPEERDLQGRADHGSQVHQRPHPDRWKRRANFFLRHWRSDVIGVTTLGIKTLSKTTLSLLTLTNKDAQNIETQNNDVHDNDTKYIDR